MAKFLEKPQWISGEEVASFLDTFFEQFGWEITPTTPREERDLCLGDRHYNRAGVHFYIEYKSGIQTFYTGNVFLETVSVDSQAKPGWVYTCKADAILYAALLNRAILVFLPDTLRARIEDLKRQFKQVATSKNQNDGYKTHGVIVPLEYAQQHLVAKVIPIDRT